MNGFAPYFKNKTIKMTSVAPRGSDAPIRISRFEMDDAQCMAFAQSGGIGQNRAATSTTSNPNFEVIGIYCASVGESISDETTKAVLAGWTFVANPGSQSAR